MKNTKKIVLLSIFTSLSVVLSIVDSMITEAAFSFIPMARIGLANVIVLLVAMNFRFEEGLVLVLIKSLLANLLYRGPIAFIIGGTASLISFLVMYYLYKLAKTRLSEVGISVAGGFAHIVTQLLVTTFIYHMQEEIIIYGVLLVLLSLITSIIIGFIVQKLAIYYHRITE